jgi:hypothetical protein
MSQKVMLAQQKVKNEFARGKTGAVVYGFYKLLS